jgi:hypothetical protein
MTLPARTDVTGAARSPIKSLRRYGPTAISAAAFDLVGGHDDHAAHRVDGERRLEHVDGAHHVGAVRRAAVGPRGAHEWLRREVEHDVGGDSLHRGVDGVAVAHVGLDRVRARGDAEVHKRTPWRRRQRDAVHFSAEEVEPGREPRTLETGVAGDECARSAECCERGGIHSGVNTKGWPTN